MQPSFCFDVKLILNPIPFNSIHFFYSITHYYRDRISEETIVINDQQGGGKYFAEIPRFVRNHPIIRGTRSKGNIPAANIPKLRVNISCIGSSGESSDKEWISAGGVRNRSGAGPPSGGSEYHNIFSYPACKYWNLRNSPEFVLSRKTESAIICNTKGICHVKMTRI